MPVINRLRGPLAIVCVLLLGIPADLLARNRKSEKYYKLAQKAEDRKDWETALTLYEKALHEDPAEVGYISGMHRVRFQAGQAHVEKGIALRKQGQLEQALGEFQRAFALDPSSAIALEEIKTTNGMIDKVKKGATATDTPRQEAAKATQDRIESLLPVPELKPIESRVKNLKMNNQPVRVLYETVGALAGINVILDPNFQSPSSKTANVNLSNASLEEALNYIALVTHTFWKPVNSNTIFVTEENPTKRRDYEDNVVKVFYLKNVTTPQEFQELITAVRSATDIRHIFPYNAQSAVIVRATPDQIAICEKLFHDLDKPKPEVVVDIIIMTTDVTRTRDIAAALSTSGLNLPIAFTPRSSIAVANSSSSGSGTSGTGTAGSGTGTGIGTGAGTGVGTGIGTGTGTGTGTGGSVALSNIFKVSSRDFSTSLPGALLQAMLEDSSTHVMQSPQVRASDGMKVTLKVGQKYPYATGSFQPGVGAVGVSPLVSTQFQFLDTGVDLELQPHVHGTDEVTLHVDIKLSNVQSTVNLGGLSQPVVAQQTNATDVRLRDGQVTLLGGLMSTTESSDVTGIPGIMNVPVLGQFLGSTNNKKRQHDELIIALVPHIVRVPDMDDTDFRGVYVGSETVAKVMRAADPEPKPAETAQPVNPASAAPTPVAPPAAPVMPALRPPLNPNGPVSGLTLTFGAADVHAKLGAPAAVTLEAEHASDLFSLPVKIRWDASLLKLESAVPGAFVAQDGRHIPNPAVIHNDIGEATITLSRLPGASGVTGSGPLAVFHFLPLRKGTGKITISEAEAKNSRLEHIEASRPEIGVTVE